MYIYILTYIPLKQQINAEQSFLGNHGLKIFLFSRYRGQKPEITSSYFLRMFLFFQIYQLCTVSFTPIKIFL